MIRLIPLLCCLASPVFGEVGSCPISADFVTAPESIDSVVAMAGRQVNATTRRSFVDGAVVSIECTGIASEIAFPNWDDATILANYAKFWSITQLGKVTSDTHPVVHSVLAGVKEIQGIEVTYTYHFFRFEGSFAMVATGVPGGVPTPDVIRFLDSIVVENTDQFSQDEKIEGRKGHFATCIPAIRKDNNERQLGMSEIEIAYFCSCTGQRYFDGFSKKELSTLALGNDPTLLARREEMQAICLTEATN